MRGGGGGGGGYVIVLMVTRNLIVPQLHASAFVFNGYAALLPSLLQPFPHTGFDNDLGIRPAAGISFQKPGEQFETTLEHSRGETA